MRVHHPQPKVEFLPTPPNTNFDDDGDDCSSRGGSGNSFFAPPFLPPQALELPIPHIQKSPPPLDPSAPTGSQRKRVRSHLANQYHRRAGRDVGWLGERGGLWRKYGSEVAGGGKEQLSFLHLKFLLYTYRAQKRWNILSDEKDGRERIKTFLPDIQG